MKRIIIGLALVLASGNVFAADARTQVMGNGDPFGFVTQGGGSLYMSDNYNIFYNPSYANDAKNWATVERNAAGTANGGFVNSMSNMAVGAFFNRNTAVQPGGSGIAVNPLDIVVAGDAGVKWGAMLTYGKNSGGTDVSDTVMGVRAGFQIGDIHPFVGMQFVGSDKTSATVTNKTTAMSAGFRYMFGEWAPYAYVAQMKYTAQSTAAVKNSAYGLGIGRTVKAGDSSTLNYSIGVHGSSSQQWILPIDISVETEFTSWLTGRAGLNHRWVDRTGGVSNANATTGRIGAMMKFGKADFDFAVGGAGGVDSATFDFANGLFTTASVTYHW